MSIATGATKAAGAYRRGKRRTLRQKNKHDAHTELCVIARVTPMRLRNGTTQQTIKSTYTCPEALYQRPTDRTRTQSPSVALPAWLPLQHFARPLSQQPRSCSLTEVGGPNAYAKRAIWRRCGGRLRRTCQAKRSATCVSRDAPSSLLSLAARIAKSETKCRQYSMFPQ